MMLYPGAGYPGLYFPLVGIVSGRDTNGLRLRNIRRKQPQLADQQSGQPSLVFRTKTPKLSDIEGD